MKLTQDKDMNQYLIATKYFDYLHPAVDDLFQQLTARTPKDKAVEIYYIVRDNYLYNPYCFVDGFDSFKASYCLKNGEGYCIPKTSLMIALCRKAGIPARLGLADVVNHLATPKLLALLGTEIFSMHGYAELYINGQWVKATPAFNQSLCEKMQTLPLEFNGEEDSVFQSLTGEGEKHMEYLVDWGTFAELPLEFIMMNLEKHYPHLMHKMSNEDIAPALETE
jgi:transglutaminase-like putative cysteine protease